MSQIFTIDSRGPGLFSRNSGRGEARPDQVPPPSHISQNLLLGELHSGACLFVYSCRIFSHTDNNNNKKWMLSFIIWCCVYCATMCGASPNKLKANLLWRVYSEYSGCVCVINDVHEYSVRARIMLLMVVSELPVDSTVKFVGCVCPSPRD